MDRHYILNLNPQANSEWDRCVLRNPLSGERPDLSTEIAKAVSDRASYSRKAKLCKSSLDDDLGLCPCASTEETSATAFRAGSYLIKVKLEVEILEQNLTNSNNRLELPASKKSTVIKQDRLAS